MRSSARREYGEREIEELWSVLDAAAAVTDGAAFFICISDQNRTSAFLGSAA